MSENREQFVSVLLIVAVQEAFASRPTNYRMECTASSLVKPRLVNWLFHFMAATFVGQLNLLLHPFRQVHRMFTPENES